MDRFAPSLARLPSPWLTLHTARWPADLGVTFGADALDQVQGKQRIRQLLADPDMPKPFCAFSPPGKDGACYPESKWNIDVYSKCSRSLCVFLRSLKDAAAQTIGLTTPRSTRSCGNFLSQR